MTTRQFDDVVSRQYERWVYPEPIDDLPEWTAGQWQWFDPSISHRLLWPDRDYWDGMDVLIAGCGANQGAVLAYNNPGARVVAVDVSESSLGHEQRLKDAYDLANLELRRLPVEHVGELGADFDLIVTTGVLHHLADPQAGMDALAGCLRRDGVLAVMLYARYGRAGVEMMQGVFRDLGLEQDEASLAVVKAALADAPAWHPIRGYLEIAPDVSYDAGLVDTFLHQRDTSFTVDDCLDLVASAGLVFQDWHLKSPYYPPVAKRSDFYAAVAALPVERQWSVMERVNSQNACHFFTACRPDRPTGDYAVDFAADAFADYVPSFRHRCGIEGRRLNGHAGTVNLTDAQLALARRVDGERTIAQITAEAAESGELGQLRPDEARERARSVFTSLWQRDIVAIRLR